MPQEVRAEGVWEFYGWRQALVSVRPPCSKGVYNLRRVEGMPQEVRVEGVWKFYG